MRYHGYFLGSACFTLIYNIIHDESTATTHLPWVYAALQTLSEMRAGDPITNTISAIQTILRKINPSYEWSPSAKSTEPGVHSTESTSLPQTAAYEHNKQLNMPDSVAHPSQTPAIPAEPPNFQPILPPLEMPETVGEGEDLLDFTQSDMGWDFDFSTMDLEAFFSVYQPMAAPKF